MPEALPESPTGADLVAAVAAYARRKHIRERQLLLQLTSDPGKWKKQTAEALHPKPHTIERVRKLLAGEPVPSPPPNNFHRAALRGAEADAEVRRRLAAGCTLAEIAADPDIPANAIERVTSAEASDEPNRRRADFAAGSNALRNAIAAEAAASQTRRALARSIGTVVRTLDCERPPTARAVAIASDADPRPAAWSRDPCLRCGTRGDFGCAHQRPWEDAR